MSYTHVDNSEPLSECTSDIQNFNLDVNEKEEGGGSELEGSKPDTSVAWGLFINANWISGWNQRITFSDY